MTPFRYVLYGLGISLVLTTSAWAEVRVQALFQGKALLSVDGQSHLLHEGESSPQEVKLISSDSERAVVEIRGKRHTLELSGPQRVGGNFKPPQRQSVSIWPDNAGMYITSGSINGRVVDFLLDSGATFISINRQQAERLGIDYLSKGQPVAMATASRLEKFYKVKLDKVTVGEITLRNVDAVISSGSYPPIVLLGMSFLGQLDMQRSGDAWRLSTQW